MKPINFKSIQSRLTFWFLLLSLGPMLIGILITFSQLKHSIQQETYNKLIAIRDLKTQQVNKWLDERIGDIQVMAGNYEIRTLENIFEKEVKSTDDYHKIEIARELLNRNKRNYEVYEEYFFIDANTGLIVISTKQEFEGLNKALDPYFTEPIESGELCINDIFFSTTIDGPQMTFSIPIYCLEHNTHIIGILVARINLDDSFYKLLLNRTGLGESGETFLVNKDVVAISELRHYENAPLNLKIATGPAVNAADGKAGILKTMDYCGTKVLAAYTYIPRTGWGFVCKQDMHELNAPIRDLLKKYIILYLLSIIVVVLIVLWIIKIISKPIVEMNTATQKIKKGDYTVRTVVSSTDELGSLAYSINEMAASIETVNNIQKGVAGISDTMIELSSIHDFGAGLLKQLMKITGANMATFYILNEAISQFEHFTSGGSLIVIDG